MLAHGRASKAQMNMDVNLCRLPELFLYFMKFLETLNNAVTYGERPENSYIFPEYTYNKKCILTFFFNVLNYM